MIKHLLLFITYLILSTTLFAQQKKITLTVLNKNNNAIPAATVTLTCISDSSLQYSTYTDTLGKAVINLDSTKKYQYVVTAVGYKAFNKIINLQMGSKATITLQNLTNKGNTVTVVARKPIITQEDDKTIIDPEPLAQSATNAFEVLEKTPGIFTDQDGNFYLSSTTPATIQINGRDMRLSANDLATLIKSLPPNSIQKIEIVRTPSAKNDASGSGGVINIILKKGVKLGLAGSLFFGLNQGKYGNQFAGISLSNSSNKKTKYLYTGFNTRATLDELNSNRKLNIDTLLQQNSDNYIKAKSPYANFGGSYMPNKVWDLGYDANLTYNISNNNSVNLNGVNKQSLNNTFIKNTNDVVNSGNTTNILQNLNAKYKADSGRIEWISSLSYSYYNYNNDQNYGIKNLLGTSGNAQGSGEQHSYRNLTTIQTDLTYKPLKKLTLEVGAKTAWLSFNNATNFVRNGVNDVTRTNKFAYRENITAAYLQASKTIEKVVVKGGLRMEITNMKGTQKIPTTQKFGINRTDLFPYLYISRPVVTIMKYDLKAYLVYRKSITRPGYDLLNPFSRFVDNYLSEVGNPNLKPQFTETYEANLSFEEQPILAIGRNITSGLFTNVVYQNPNNPSEVLRTYDNLGSNTENFFRFTAALPPGGKYFFVIGGQRNFNTYNGLYEGKPLQFSNKSWNFFTYHQLKLDNRSNIYINAWMQTGGLFQFYQLSNLGQVNFTINRQYYHKKLIISASVRDIFFTNQNSFTINQGNINAFGNRLTDSRRFGLNIRYNFGIKKKEDQEKEIKE